MNYPIRLQHHVESMNEKGRWLEAIGETGAHYLVMLRNASSGIGSHVHAVLKKDYSPVDEKKKKTRDEQIEDLF